MQNHYNLLYREEEREMFPTLKVKIRYDCLCDMKSDLGNEIQHLGVGSIPWSPLARGVLTRPLWKETTRSSIDRWDSFHTF